MSDFLNLLNNNTWVVAVTIFLLTILVWWISGLFSYIRNKPSLKIKRYSEIIPHFFVSGWLSLNKEKESWFEVERLVLFLWLSVSNIWFSDTTIESYRLEYEDINWKKHKLVPMSLPEPLSHWIWEYQKVFPSLTTNYPHFWHNNSWKIDVGSNILWFLYFNIEYFWSYQPLIKNNKISAKLFIEDVYWKTYQFKVDIVEKNIDYLSKFIKPDILLNHNSYEDAWKEDNK